MILLNAMNRSDNIEEIYEQAIRIENIRKDILHYNYGIMLAKKERYNAAISAYSNSIKYSLITADIEFYNEAIKRCQLKHNSLAAITSKTKPFIS